jgi:hypothetical protein
VRPGLQAVVWRVEGEPGHDARNAKASVAAGAAEDNTQESVKKVEYE